MARLTKIRGTQVGLRHGGLVDVIKTDMRADTFRFAAPEGQIGGILDRQGIYHVMEGHHRMVAALELFAETGDDHFIRELISWGIWELAPALPTSRPMPSRSWIGKLRNRLGY